MAQLLLRKPSIEIPAPCKTCKPKGLGFCMERGLLPAENALKRRAPMWLSRASANMLRAQLWVQRNRTFKILGVVVMVLLQEVEQRRESLAVQACPWQQFCVR